MINAIFHDKNQKNRYEFFLRADSFFHALFRCALMLSMIVLPRLAMADAGSNDGTSAVTFLDNLSSSKWAEVIALVSFFVAMCGLAFGFMGGKSVMGCLFLAAFLKFGPMVIDYFFTNAGSS